MTPACEWCSMRWQNQSAVWTSRVFAGERSINWKPQAFNLNWMLVQAIGSCSIVPWNLTLENFLHRDSNTDRQATNARLRILRPMTTIYSRFDWSEDVLFLVQWISFCRYPVDSKILSFLSRWRFPWKKRPQYYFWTKRYTMPQGLRS